MTDEKKCIYCGTEKDLRPYGPGGSFVCHDCAFATPERKAQTEAAFFALVQGSEAISPVGAAMVGQESGPVPFDPDAMPEDARYVELKDKRKPGVSDEHKLIARVRTILGDDPDTIENDHPAPIVPMDNSEVTCVEVAGLGHVLYATTTGRAMFTQGPGTERDADVIRSDDSVEVTVIKNARGQRRMVVVIEGLT